MNTTSLAATRPDLDGLLHDWERLLADPEDEAVFDLPGFPEVSLQVQRMLANDDISSERIVRLLGAEPLLAARVMSLANSAAMNASSTPIQDLRNAVARLGFDSLRAAAMAYAVAQLRRAREYSAMVRPLSNLWQQSVRLSAAACAIAKRTGRVSADTALYAGLVAGIGKLYLLTRIAAAGFAFDEEAVQAEVERCHSEFAARLLNHWRSGEELVEAVRCHERLLHAAHAPSTLADVLSVARLLCDCYDTPVRLDTLAPSATSAQRLGLDAEACKRLLLQGKAELAALRAALGS